MPSGSPACCAQSPGGVSPPRWGALAVASPQDPPAMLRATASEATKGVTASLAGPEARAAGTAGALGRRARSLSCSVVSPRWTDGWTHLRTATPAK